MSERVKVDMKDGVADVRMVRGDKLNAVDPAMFKALAETGRALCEDRSLRAVVLSGEGRGFCAGLDMASMAGLAKGGDGGGARDPGESADLLRPSSESPANSAQASAWVWTEVPVPVIAAVHGVAFGAGLQIALGADIRIVSPDVRFSVMEIKWGLIPDVAGTQTLRDLVRLDIARELTYTGREVNGQEAVEIGLATKLSDTPREDALEMARLIASKSPSAIRSAKRLMAESRHVSFAEGLKLEEKLQRGLIGGPNQIESVRANMEKRAPRFQDPD